MVSQREVSIDQLVAQLRALGVAEGAHVMVHASMRRLGPVRGGAEATLTAILQVLGASGTLLMVLGADEDEPFDAATTPVDVEDMGILAETFRQRPGAIVSDHAAARFAALGPDGDWLINPCPLNDYHGPGSVLERLVEIGGLVLRLGAEPDTVTLTHYAEYLSNVPNKRRVELRYVRADIGEQRIGGLDDSDGIVDWSQGDYFPQILLDYIADRRVRIGPVGNTTAELFSAPEFVDFAVEWMNRNLLDAAGVRSAP